jgi:hypothetical protein
MPVSTIRAWLLGIIWAILIPGTNQFFFFRYPSVSVTPVCASTLLELMLYPKLIRNPYEQLIPLLASFPIGRLWARYVPKVTIFGAELNPGPFSIKEHVIITIMSSVASSPAYAVCYLICTKFEYF